MDARVFIGSIPPMLRVGLEAELADAGMDVVGTEDDVRRIPEEVARIAPDAVMLDRDDADAGSLSAQVREACATATVVLWARDETVIEVLDPGAEVTRTVFSSVPADLYRVLAASRSAT